MGGFITMIGGLIIMLGCCGTPQGVNPNDKTVMINPPGAYHNEIRHSVNPIRITGSGTEHDLRNRHSAIEYIGMLRLFIY